MMVYDFFVVACSLSLYSFMCLRGVGELRFHTCFSACKYPSRHVCSAKTRVKLNPF